MRCNAHSTPIHRRSLAAALALALAAASGSSAAQALTPAFTYQGELRSAGSPANAAFDFEFRLYNAEAGGSQIGALVTRLNVPVTNGLFSVPLDFGPAQFAGERQWLEIAIRPAGGGAYETLSPRTEVTAAPYAWSAAVALGNSVTTTSIVDGTVGTADINASQIQRRVTGSCPAGQYVRVVAQDGSVTCGSDANAGGTVTSVATGAGLTGGPITTTGTISVAPGGIGTTQINATQVQRRVAGTCAVGSYVQQVNEDGAVVCGTDATGSDWSLAGNAGTNPVTNFIGTTDAQAFVVRTANVRSLRIEPSAERFGALLPLPITANMIGGSRANEVVTGVRGATIAGGGLPLGNSDPTFFAEGPNRVTDAFGTIGGGYANQSGDDAGTTLDRAFATVAGGVENTASGEASTVGGGETNTASGFRSTVGGGADNTASGLISTVGGGSENTASGTLSTIGGGSDNTASSSRSTVSGGSMNTASGINSTVGGGERNCAGGRWSWAGGFRAKVRPGTDAGADGSGCDFVPSAPIAGGDFGTFVWADSQEADFVSTGANRFLVRAQGGIYLGTNSTVSMPVGRFINTSTGAHLTNGGIWVNSSSRALKTAFESVDAGDVLARLLALPLTRWQYRDSPAEGVHLGPVAEDFHAAFGLGADGHAISTVDASGVALAAIQGLNAKLEAENAELRAESAELRAELERRDAEYRARLNAIEARLGGGP